MPGLSLACGTPPHARKTVSRRGFAIGQRSATRTTNRRQPAASDD